MFYVSRAIRHFPRLFAFILTVIGLLLFSSHGRTQGSPDTSILKDFSWVSVTWDADTMHIGLSGIKPGECQMSALSNPPRIIIDVPSRTCAQDKPAQASYDFSSGLLTQLRAAATPQGTRIVLESKYELHWEEAETRSDRSFAITILLRFRQTVEEMKIDKGTTYISRRYVTPSGQRFVHAVVCDPRESELRPSVYFAGDVTRKTVARVGEIVSGARAAAAVNGGYFSGSGTSLSMVIQDGEMKAPPQLHRPAFMVMKDGTCRIEYPVVRATVTDSHGIKIEVDTINERPTYGHISLLTPGHPSRIRGDMGGTKAVINGSTVEYITDGDVEDYSDRFILWSYKEYSPVSSLRAGERIEIAYHVARSNPEIVTAIGGGPFLLHKGHVAITTDQDDIGRDISVGRSARTAVGLDDEGRVYLAVVESPSSDRSIGSTLEELAWTMQDMGATYAMNLDGGSSSAMALGSVHPETSLPGGNRSVMTSLVLIDRTAHSGKQPIYF
jgi:exopolysaccharide biosynthesis protein